MEKYRYGKQDNDSAGQMAGFLLTLCALIFLSVFGLYMVLAFADAIDGEINKGKIERQHLLKVMQAEQSELNAANKLKEAP